MKTRNFKEKLLSGLTAITQKSGAIVETISSSATDFSERRRLEIMLGAGTLAMGASMGALFAAGTEAASTGAEKASAIAYDNMAPEHLTDSARPETRSHQPVPVAVETSQAASVDAILAGGVGGILLFGVGATAGVYALRGISLREAQKNEPEEGAVSQISLISEAFQKTYRPSLSERFDNYCGEAAAAAIIGTQNIIARGIHGIRTWLAARETSIETQLAVSTTSYKPFDIQATAIESITLCNQQ
jgi:hypothetical protein